MRSKRSTHPAAFECALLSTDMETLLVKGGIPLALAGDSSLSAEVCLTEAADLIPVADLTAIADDLVVLLRRLGDLLQFICAPAPVQVIETSKQSQISTHPVFSIMWPSISGGVSQICSTRSDIRAFLSLTVISLNLAVRPTTEEVLPPLSPENGRSMSNLSIASED